MRDLLPLYVNGKLTAPNQAAVESHVGSCDDCAAEVELLRMVARAFPTPTLSVPRIVATLPARRAAMITVPFHRQPLWRVAASLTLFIAGTATVLLVRGREPVVPQAGLTQPLSRPETTLAMAPGANGSQARDGAVMSLGADLSDLSDSQLESLLGSLDGLDPRPQADPTTIAMPIIQERTQAPGRSNQ